MKNMKRLAIFAIAATALAVNTVSVAQTLQSLNKNQATQALQGNTIKTISLVTLNNQLIENAFTGFFDKNGKVIGQMTNKPADEPQKDTGNWTVKADGTVCATWDHWNSNKPICVALYKLTNGLLLVNEESKKFESLILKDDIKSGNQMN